MSETNRQLFVLRYKGRGKLPNGYALVPATSRIEALKTWEKSMRGIDGYWFDSVHPITELVGFGPTVDSDVRQSLDVRMYNTPIH